MADLLTGLGGLEVLYDKANWSSAVSASYEMSRQIFSHTGTIEQIINYSDERPHKLDLSFLFENKAEEYAFLTFFFDKRGRWKRFWLPAPATAFSLAMPTVIGVPSVIVKSNRFGQFYRGFERIFLLLASGDRLTFQITSVQEGQPLAGQDTINLGAALDRIITINDIVQFSLLLCGRFDKDVAELEYPCVSNSTCKITFLELVRDYPA